MCHVSYCAACSMARVLCGGDWSESDPQDGNTALISAAENDHTGCARLLIDAGADKNAKAHSVRVGCFPAVFLTLE